MYRFIVALVVVTTFCLLAFSENHQTSPFDVSYAPSGIQWSVFVPSSGTVLTVSGPDGYSWKQVYGPDSRPQFGPADERGVPRPEGLYRWELVAELPPGAGGEVPDEPNPVVSGSFVISSGVIIPKPDDAQPAMVEEGAPLRSLFLDRAGRLGLGTTVPQSQLHLKGSSPALTLEDTTSGGRTFTLRGLEKGDGSLGLFDQAGEARWLVDGEGRVGINTTQPTSTLTVDGYIETTKGFLVNGRPVGIGFGLIGGSQPLYVEDPGKAIFGSNAGAVNTAGNVAFFGTNAGAANTTGAYNSFFGQAAGFDNTTGQYNSFFGMQAGNQNTTSSHNSAFGYRAGFTNATGPDNAFFGSEAGLNTTAWANSFFGRSAGLSNTTGPYNCFFGFEAGYSNTTAIANSFFGDRSGRANTTGATNSFFGASAGRSNTIGAQNSFFGVGSGGNNTGGSDNSFFGDQSGSSNTVESGNTFIGTLSNGAAGIANATALGYRAGVTQANSLVLGSIPNVNQGTSYVNVGNGTTTPYYSIHVMRTGANAAVMAQRTDGAANYMNAGPNYANFGSANNYPLRLTVNATWRLQLNLDNSLAMVNGATCTAGGVWTDSSSREVKDNISALSSQEAIETLDGLSPVKFNYKADQTERYVGFIAEEVPDLVAMKDRRSLSPMDIIAVLTKVVQEQQAELAGLKTEVETLKALLRAE